MIKRSKNKVTKGESINKEVRTNDTLRKWEGGRCEVECEKFSFKPKTKLCKE